MEIDDKWLTFIARYTTAKKVIMPPPPPIESDDSIRRHPGAFAERFRLNGIEPAPYRLTLWEVYSQMLREQGRRHCTGFVDIPDIVLNAGYLKEIYGGPHPNHANMAYGELMLRHIIELTGRTDWLANIPVGTSQGKSSVGGSKVSVARLDQRDHPYRHLSDRAFWKQAVAEVSTCQVDPVGEVPFRIRRSDKVATAGSCFAQHISKKIRASGFHFLVTENPADNVSGNDEAGSFYDFSARYGNIYTTRQLVQLFDRAFSYFHPLDDHWLRPDKRLCDPFRPRIEPDGFESIEALVGDRQRHLAAVREMFNQLDVFIFTLGLTECWLSRLDGAAYPVAPGVAGGVFDPSRHEFVNFTVDEIVSDLKMFIRKLRLVNSSAKLILTVSPVPLAATYEPTHVLVATTYSKSVLRVAAEAVSRSSENVYYFPSFEIITGSYNRGRYFGKDLRSVTEEGVDHVMSVFMRNLTEGGDMLPLGFEDTAANQIDKHMQEMAALAQADCDEELLQH
jgi:hypothetical protein